jgi:hypothetical protein
MGMIEQETVRAGADKHEQPAGELDLLGSELTSKEMDAGVEAKSQRLTIWYGW